MTELFSSTFFICCICNILVQKIHNPLHNPFLPDAADLSG